MILYADSGSTKTDWALKIRNKQGKFEILNWKSGGWNPYYLSSEQMIKEGKEFIKKIHSENQNNLKNYISRISEIQFYGSGCSTQSNRDIVWFALKELFPSALKIEVAHDLLGAARASCGDKKGIAIILGTGSNACLYDGQKVTQELTNLGFWLGDEGSGGFLGKRLITEYLYNHLPSEIHKLFLETYQLDREKVLQRAYQQPKPNEFFASVVPFLYQHQDNFYVRKLIIESFDTFLQRIEEEFEGLENDFYAVGSVAYYFQDILSDTIKERGGRLAKIVKSPIEGLAT